MVYLPKALLQALQVQLSIGTGPQLCPESFNTIMVWVLVLVLRLTKALLHLGSWPGCHGCGMSRRRKATVEAAIAMPAVGSGGRVVLSFVWVLSQTHRRDLEACGLAGDGQLGAIAGL